MGLSGAKEVMSRWSEIYQALSREPTSFGDYYAVCRVFCLPQAILSSHRAMMMTMLIATRDPRL
jgi:hypothetical protein